MILRGLILTLLLAAFLAPVGFSQADVTPSSGPLPKEVRGYKVHRASIEMKQPPPQTVTDGRKRRASDSPEREYDEREPLLLKLGEARLVDVSPLGVTFDVPVIVEPVKQSGEIDRLVFENMMVNDIPVTIADHVRKFKLPNKEPLTLMPGIRVFVSTPQAVVRTIDELLSSRSTWPVTGRVYVCGHFKKYFLKFKRAVPVEINARVRNPIR